MRSDGVILGVLATACLLGAAACAGTIDDPVPFISALETAPDGGARIGCGDVESLLSKQCGTSGCHGGEDPAAALDLATPGILARTAGKPASRGGVLVVPGDPQASVLYLKLTSTPPFGARMPYGSSLDEASIACVHGWITSSP